MTAVDLLPMQSNLDGMADRLLPYSINACTPNERDLCFASTFDIDELLKDSSNTESTGVSPTDASFPGGEDFFQIPNVRSTSFQQRMTSLRGQSMDLNDSKMIGAEELDCPTEPKKARRQAQNRAAQRAFRERKEKYIQELEGKVVIMSKKIASLESDRKRLEGLVKIARTEVETLRSLPSQLTAQSRPMDRSQIACKIDGVPGRQSLVLTLDLGIQAIKLCPEDDQKTPSTAVVALNDQKDFDQSPG